MTSTVAPARTPVGTDLERLAARVGATPFFAYERARIRERVDVVRAVLPREVRLRYAVKANPMVAVIQQFATLVDGFDVASGSELRHALDTSTAPADIGFAGPGKTTAELRCAVAAGVLLQVESAGELARIGSLADDLGVQPRVALRVNPPFATARSGLRLGGASSQFGIDAEQVPDLLATFPRSMELVGFQFFAGSQNLDAEQIAAAQRRSVELAVDLARQLDHPITHLGLGGGFGIPYSSRDRPLDLALIGRRMGELLAGPVQRHLPEAAVVLELGRYLVGEAGWYVTRVVDRKSSRGRVFVVVDGGMHHQLAASGNLGQVVRRNFPVFSAVPHGDRPEETVTVVGCLCTPLDLLAADVALPTPGIGDLIVIGQAGAYGRTASPTAFLGHPEPLEVLI